MKLGIKVFFLSLSFLLLLPASLALFSCNTGSTNNSLNEKKLIIGEQGTIEEKTIITEEQKKNIKYKEKMLDYILYELWRMDYKNRIKNIEWLNFIEKTYRDNIHKSENLRDFLVTSTENYDKKITEPEYYYDNRSNQYNLSIVENDKEIIVNRLGIALWNALDYRDGSRYLFNIYDNFTLPISFKIYK